LIVFSCSIKIARFFASSAKSASSISFVVLSHTLFIYLPPIKIGGVNPHSFYPTREVVIAPLTAIVTGVNHIGASGLTVGANDVINPVPVLIKSVDAVDLPAQYSLNATSVRF
jgi:hypothetical protein